MKRAISSVTERGKPYYAHQLLSQTVDFLAVGPGDVRSRLLGAYAIFHPLNTKHFPDHLKPDFEWVEAQLTKHPARLSFDGTVTRGSVEVSLMRMKNSTGAKIASVLLRLHYAIEACIREDG